MRLVFFCIVYVLVFRVFISFFKILKQINFNNVNKLLVDNIN